MSSSPSISLGALTPWSTQGEYNTHYFAIQSALSKMQTATLVKVLSCTNDGGVSPIGTVNVQPLVNQVDGNGLPTPHITVFGLPYLRIQGGANACIIDPVAGDIGVAVFASRDISNVKSTQAQANPGSGRQYDYADGIYLGCALSAAAPTQYLQFNSDGITILTPNTVDITATGNIILRGATIQAGSSPVAVLIQPFLTWLKADVMPFLTGLGYAGPPPPTNSVTTTFEAS